MNDKKMVLYNLFRSDLSIMEAKTLRDAYRESGSSLNFYEWVLTLTEQTHPYMQRGRDFRFANDDTVKTTVALITLDATATVRIGEQWVNVGGVTVTAMMDSSGDAWFAGKPMLKEYGEFEVIQVLKELR